MALKPIREGICIGHLRVEQFPQKFVKPTRPEVVQILRKMTEPPCGRPVRQRAAGWGTVVHRSASGRLTRSASRYACGCCEALLNVEAFNAAQQLNVFETRPAAPEAGFRVSVIVALPRIRVESGGATDDILFDRVG